MTTAVNLSKGEALDLTKTNPGLTKVLVGLGWTPAAAPGVSFDLDASAFLLNADGKVQPGTNLVFFNNLKSPCGSVVHNGDNLTGQGSGDDETITVDLSLVPAEIQKIVIAVTIHEAATRGQRFGQVKDAYIRVLNADTNVELGKCDLTEDSSSAQAMIFGELYRRDTEWRFKALYEAVYNTAGAPGELMDLCTQFGIPAKK